MGSDEILLIDFLFNVYTMVVHPMSMDVMFPFGIDDKTLSIIFIVFKTINLYYLNPLLISSPLFLVSW